MGPRIMGSQNLKPSAGISWVESLKGDRQRLETVPANVYWVPRTDTGLRNLTLQSGHYFIFVSQEGKLRLERLGVARGVQRVSSDCAASSTWRPLPL